MAFDGIHSSVSLSGVSVSSNHNFVNRKIGKRRQTTRKDGKEMVKRPGTKLRRLQKDKKRQKDPEIRQRDDKKTQKSSEGSAKRPER